MEITLSKLNIGFNSEVKVVERNEFEITGDISIKIETEERGFGDKLNFWNVDKLRVVYNHDGLLEHIYNGEPCIPDNLLLFRDVETYVNMSHGGQIPVDLDDSDLTDVLLTDDNSINVYADLTLTYE